MNMELQSWMMLAQVPPLNFANTSVVLRTIDALLTTNPPQTAKALLAVSTGTIAGRMRLLSQHGL
jgi:hypothetical protein